MITPTGVDEETVSGGNIALSSLIKAGGRKSGCILLI